MYKSISNYADLFRKNISVLTFDFLQIKHIESNTKEATVLEAKKGEQFRVKGGDPRSHAQSRFPQRLVRAAHIHWGVDQHAGTNASRLLFIILAWLFVATARVRADT